MTFEIEHKIELATEEQHIKVKDQAKKIKQTFDITFNDKTLDKLSYEVEQLTKVSFTDREELEDNIVKAKTITKKTDFMFQDITNQIDKFKSSYKVIDTPVREIEKIIKALKTNIKKTIEKSRIELQTGLLELQKEEIILKIDENDTIELIDEEKKEKFEKRNSAILIKNKISNSNITINATNYMLEMEKSFKRKFKDDLDFLNVNFNENYVKELVRKAYQEDEENLKTLLGFLANKGIKVIIQK